MNHSRYSTGERAPAAARVARARHDIAVALLGLLLIAAWEAAGADLAVSRALGGPAGFAWKDAWVTRVLLHDGGRWLAGVALALLALDACRPWRAGPPRHARGFWFGVVVACLALVPALKHASLTSCPWDLAEFGGHAAYVPHWLLGVGDGGPGRCFPSGHAVASFAFLGVYFLWRGHRPAAARGVLALVLAGGTAFAAAQVLRGAHFVSHALWSAWLCWVVAAVSEQVASRVGACRPAVARDALAGG